jgi:hypothetical protein
MKQNIEGIIKEAAFVIGGLIGGGYMLVTTCNLQHRIPDYIQKVQDERRAVTYQRANLANAQEEVQGFGKLSLSDDFDEWSHCEVRNDDGYHFFRLGSMWTVVDPNNNILIKEAQRVRRCQDQIFGYVCRDTIYVEKHPSLFTTATYDSLHEIFRREIAPRTYVKKICQMRKRR